jgi:isoquinoline 1-oxidoreductase alpha subunit
VRSQVLIILNLSCRNGQGKIQGLSFRLLASADLRCYGHLKFHPDLGDRMTSFVLNGKSVEVDVDPATPLLWVLRESFGLTGTKYGCGMALCGACTVHLDGEAIRSCVAPLARVEGKHVKTIEGLSNDLSHPLQKAWIEIDVPQCGYCQSGQIMTAAVLLSKIPKPTDTDIDEAMSGNICRCGTYPRIRRAIHRAAELAGGKAAAAKKRSAEVATTEVKR